jgi:hypothetical protein
MCSTFRPTFVSILTHEDSQAPVTSVSLSLYSQRSPGDATPQSSKNPAYNGFRTQYLHVVSTATSARLLRYRGCGQRTSLLQAKRDHIPTGKRTSVSELHVRHNEV